MSHQHWAFFMLLECRVVRLCVSTLVSYLCLSFLLKGMYSQAQWCTPVILAAQEVEIRRIAISG
jgi:hypothetical protein